MQGGDPCFHKANRGNLSLLCEDSEAVHEHREGRDARERVKRSLGGLASGNRTLSHMVVIELWRSRMGERWAPSMWRAEHLGATISSCTTPSVSAPEATGSERHGVVLNGNALRALGPPTATWIGG